MESTDALGTRASANAELAPEAGFDGWLRDQCPDGRALRVTGAEVGGQVEVACEDVREGLLADAPTRERLLGVFLAQTGAPSPQELAGERLGEARQPGPISGFFCGLLVTILIGYQCDKTRSPWGSCVAASVPPSILCAVIPLP